jgi:hypothetical protein
MKHRSKHLLFILTTILTTVKVVYAQGTMVFDQQSWDESNRGEFLADISASQPIGQSFTPSLAGIGFVRLYISDRTSDGIGTTVFVNIRSGSITGAVISSTSPVALPDQFHGPMNFLFSTEIPLTPGVTYFLQPVIQSGEDFGIGFGPFNFTGGTGFFNGTPSQFDDLWFREGIIVPEPSMIGLLLVGAGIFAYARRNNLHT